MTLTQSELYDLMDLHERYLDGKPGGKQLVLIEESLCYADFSYYDLSGAIIIDCNFIHSNFSHTILHGVDMSRSEYTDCNFECAVY